MENRFSSEPVMIEKIIAALSYITSGFAGFFWLLLAIFTKNNIKPFLKYHIYQSIFLAIAFYLIGVFLGLIMNILSVIPLVNQLIVQLTFYLNAPMLFGISLIESLIFALIIYLVVTTFQSKYSYIPWVSDIIKANVR